MKKIVFFFLMITSAWGCNMGSEILLPEGTTVLHQNVRNLTDLIIYDIFSPPVAARIYSYASLASHEALRYADSSEPSIIAKLKGFETMPIPAKNKSYNYVLAASVAFYSIVREITFSLDTVKKFEEETYSPFKKILSNKEYNNSIDFGKSIATHVLKRVVSDNYKQTRTMEKYYGSTDDGKWQPTSPDYLEATEPHWPKIKSFSLDSSSQFDPGPPPAFGKDRNSVFYKMNKEVYDLTKNLTQEQKDIAYFWDDNPFVSHHFGHLMFNTKKQTPGGHWMGITAIACRNANADVVKTARAYALVAVGLLDGFISCWDTKYRYKYIRPITVINEWIDKDWNPYLQTPPFPEYTSGHSTISASAATVLTGLFGDNFAYHDDADKEYIGMVRDFKSFFQAAEEASISRLYGGIHYRLSLDIGAEVGKKVGEHVLKTCN